MWFAPCYAAGKIFNNVIYVMWFEDAIVLICPFGCTGVYVNARDGGILPVCSNVVVKQARLKAQVYRPEWRICRK